MSVLCLLFGHKREMHHLMDRARPMWVGDTIPGCGRCFIRLAGATQEDNN